MENIKRFDEALKNNNFLGSSSDPAAINYNLACAYKESLDAENQFLNFSGALFDQELPEILGELDDAGIDTITISSTFSGLLGILAKFEQDYWIVEGMTEVRANYKDIQTGRAALVPALILHYKY